MPPVDISSSTGVQLPTRLPTTRRSTATGKIEEEIMVDRIQSMSDAAGATSLRSTSLP